IDDVLEQPRRIARIARSRPPGRGCRYPQTDRSGSWLLQEAAGFGLLVSPPLRRFRPSYPGEPKSMSAIRSVRLFVVAALLATPAAYAGDLTGNAEKGKEIFTAGACVTCHGVAKGDNAKVGPTLFGVIGRQAGTAPS